MIIVELPGTRWGEAAEGPVGLAGKAAAAVTAAACGIVTSNGAWSGWLEGMGEKRETSD